MLSIDIYTCYSVAGLGALIGLGLIGMIRTDQPRVTYALTLFRWSLMCFAVMLLVQFSPSRLRPEILKLVIGFAGSGVALLGWSFRQLNGRRTPPVLGFVVTASVGLTLWLVGAFGSDQQYVQTIGVLFCLLSLGLAIDQGLITISSSKLKGSDLALLVAAAEFALNWVIVAVWAFAVPGPYHAHWLHMPEWLMPVTGLSFALLPLTVAAAVLVTINDRLSQQLRARALSDDLTGALSRRGLRELGERMVALHTSQASVLAVLMIDLDFFSSVNDRYGHTVGDDVLRHVTQVLREHLREDALLARYGGEELSVLLPVRSRAEAQAVAERLRESVEFSPWEARSGTVRVTISVGISFHGAATTLQDDLARAEVCLDEAKRMGRNRVVAGDRER
ncbi:MAG: GGDEF domain-containing protein [Aquabacterium sp.]|nr:GGDEF domain-containing protein [Aquabacterium sp.]